MKLKSFKYRFFFLTALFLLFLLLSKQYFHWIVDDLYIYFRYAENFAEGKGIVYNSGEHVEGFSGFTWFILISFFKYSGLPLELTVKVTGLILVFFLLILVYRISFHFIKNKLSFLVCALMLFNLPFMLWSQSGFEIMFCIFLQTVIFYKIINSVSSKTNICLLSFLIFLVAVSRPEGIVFSLCCLIFTYFFTSDKIYTLKISYLFFIMFFSFLVFRFMYFGDLLPNTYYAKLGHNFAGYYEFRSYKNGIFYIKDFFFHNIQFIPLLIFLPLTFKSLKRNTAILFLVCLVILQFVFVILSGGDWMVQYRFIVPAVPYLSLLTIISLKEFVIKYRIKPGMVYLFVFLLLLLSAYSFVNEDKSVIEKETVMWNRLKELTPEIKKIIPAGSLVANGSSGIIPYHLNNVTFIDIVGLTNRHIAKYGLRQGTWFERSLPEYVYEMNPGWLIMWKKKNNAAEYTFRDASPCYYEMAENDNFKKYSLVRSFDLYSDVKIEIYNKTGN